MIHEPPLSSWRLRLRDNLARARQRIAAATERSGRAADAVRLVAVTKYVDRPLVPLLIEAGCRDLGESRPQELWRKAAGSGESSAVWHLVGSLQRNKVRRTIEIARWVHSIDSLRLLQAVERVADELQRPVDLMLEVNISGEPAKRGFDPNELAEVLHRRDTKSPARIVGLMGMSGLHSKPDRTRREFALLAALRRRLEASIGDLRLPELSMGMSGDFEIAIEEGATIVRLGSLLFEGIA